jgi:hypothetical protein
MKRNIEETEFEIDSLTDRMRESNMLDGEDEYNLLLEGYNCKWDETDCLKTIDKTVSRYERYLKNVNFTEYKYMEKTIDNFLGKYKQNKENKGTNNWSVRAMEEMIEIDGRILQVIEMENITSKMSDVKVSNKKMKRTEG